MGPGNGAREQTDPRCSTVLLKAKFSTIGLASITKIYAFKTTPDSLL